MTKQQLLKSAKPILFNTDMVRAILDNRKTQTRRPKPRYKVGDILYVQETWALVNVDGDYAPPCYQGASYHYKADNDGIEACGAFNGWKPSIHMPKEAARLFLRVTDVRVERLQDITETDAEKEGISLEWAYECNMWSPTFNDPDSGGYPDYRLGFRETWDSRYAKRNGGAYSWEFNPWVEVVDFERVAE